MPPLSVFLLPYSSLFLLAAGDAVQRTPTRILYMRSYSHTRAYTHSFGSSGHALIQFRRRDASRTALTIVLFPVTSKFSHVPKTLLYPAVPLPFSRLRPRLFVGASYILYRTSVPFLPPFVAEAPNLPRARNFLSLLRKM